METSGLPLKRPPGIYGDGGVGNLCSFVDTEAFNTARLVSITWALYNALGGRKSPIYSSIVSPQNFTISTAATNIHGITQEEALRVGQPLKNIVQTFHQSLQRASGGLITRYPKFTFFILAQELYRHQYFDVLETLLARRRWPLATSGPIPPVTYEPFKKHEALVDAAFPASSHLFLHSKKTQ